MDDDQSMRDGMAGRHGLGDQAATDPNQPADQPDQANQQQAPADGAEQAAGTHAAAGQPVDQRGGDPAGPDPAADPEGHDQTGSATAATDGAGPDKPADSKAGRKRNRSFWRELPVLIVVALVIALVIKTFVVQAFFIPSISMENTLKVGDKVLVNKLVYHLRPIHPGDVIVFDGAGSWTSEPSAAKPTSDPIVKLYRVTLAPLFRSIGGLFGTAPGQTDFIKRVIGVPGDHVVCCNARGLMTVNGVALHERSYLYPGAAPSEIRFNITVPPGRLWVMGDNRLVSDDSRLHTSDPGGGTIPEDKVIGRAFTIVWPPDRWRILQIPSTFDQRGIARSALAALSDLVTATGPAAPYLPLAGGVVLALPLTLLERRVRLRRNRVPRRR